MFCLKNMRKSVLCVAHKKGLCAYNRIRQFADDTKAMGTIEVVLIVAVLVALALLFKDFITGFAGDIFSEIKNSTSGIFK